ncbi:MAG: protein kinase [Chlamydiota bacterium]
MTQEPFHKQDTQPSILDKTPAPPLPEIIGPYKIEALLSKGSMSWLYMGLDPKTKTPVVVKVLPSSLVENQESLDRFLKESKLTSLTNHPNIVKLYGEGSWEGGLYIAMEWIRGISLRQFLTKQSFSLKRSLEIILQICYALKHLHENHIIHRDLKPENILITEEGMIKVIDFGIAQIVQDTPLLLSPKIVGTPNYMSPEQKKAPNEVSYTSDIYSLGVLAYELILGKLSFGVIHTSLLPQGLRKIINKALAISVDQRYQTIDALISDLSTYLDSGEIDKEKPQQDASMELLEVFQKNSTSLSSFSPPSWTYADIGISKIKSSHKLGLYYDLFLLPGDCCLILIADPLEQGLDALFSAANLRGVVKTLIAKNTQLIDGSFVITPFIQDLHDQMALDPFISQFALSYLYLNPIAATVQFYNAGLSQVIYTPAGAVSHILYNSHPLLAKNPAEFTETTEVWNIGDVIIYHSFISEENDSPERKQEIETHLQNTLKEQMFLSAQAQADILVKELSQTSFFPPNGQTKVLFSIQRVS